MFPTVTSSSVISLLGPTLGNADEVYKQVTFVRKTFYTNGFLFNYYDCFFWQFNFDNITDVAAVFINS